MSQQSSKINRPTSLDIPVEDPEVLLRINALYSSVSHCKQQLSQLRSLLAHTSVPNRRQLNSELLNFTRTLFDLFLAIQYTICELYPPRITLPVSTQTPSAP